MAAASFELRLGRLGRRHAAYLAQVGNEQFFGAATVPVVVFCSTEAEDVLDDDVLAANFDLPITGRAAVELAGDATDQPGLVALFR
jgi:polyisoprenoid-binding protein YceI